MTLLAQMKTDMDTFLVGWGETLVRSRLTVTYDSEKKAVEDWTTQSIELTGDYQPMTGSDIRAEEGRTDKSDAKVYTVFDEDILSGDRIVRGSGLLINTENKRRAAQGFWFPVADASFSLFDLAMIAGLYWPSTGEVSSVIHTGMSTTSKTTKNTGSHL